MQLNKSVVDTVIRFFLAFVTHTGDIITKKNHFTHATHGHNHTVTWGDLIIIMNRRYHMRLKIL